MSIMNRAGLGMLLGLLILTGVDSDSYLVYLALVLLAGFFLVMPSDKDK